MAKLEAVWADGYGIWHAKVSASAAEISGSPDAVREVAVKAIHAEIAEREAHFAPETTSAICLSNSDGVLVFMEIDVRLFTCKACGKQEDKLAEFPGGICLACYSATPEANRPQSAREIARMWGGK